MPSTPGTLKVRRLNTVIYLPPKKHQLKDCTSCCANFFFAESQSSWSSPWRVKGRCIRLHGPLSQLELTLWLPENWQMIPAVSHSTHSKRADQNQFVATMGVTLSSLQEPLPTWIHSASLALPSIGPHASWTQPLEPVFLSSCSNESLDYSPCPGWWMRSED